MIGISAGTGNVENKFQDSNLFFSADGYLRFVVFIEKNLPKCLYNKHLT